MNQPEEKDRLDALLREQAPYLEDRGFTAGVIAALPRRRRRAWLRPAILLGATAIGSVLAARWLPWGDLAPIDVSALTSLDFQVLLPWLLVFAVAASLVSATLAAVQWDD